MDTLKFILNRHSIDLGQEMPVEIKLSRFHELPRIFRKCGFKVGAEIGVQKGRYSKMLCQWMPRMKLYCVDPWTAYGDYVEQHRPEDQKILDEYFMTAKQRLALYNCEFIRKTSMDAVKDFKDGSLDFVFIDGNHSFEYVVDDIAAWSRKVRRGGIISGHDYWNSAEKGSYVEGLSSQEAIKLCQVKDAVDAWTKANRIRPWFILTGDKCPSWFWVVK